MGSRCIAYFAFSRNSGRILPQSRDGAGLKLFSTSNGDCSDMKDPVGITEPYIPPYQEKVDEPIKLKKARLLYQSRKRGMLENGLILSTFAARYLDSMDPKTLSQYDRLINLPSNDWDIYYWATGVKETPVEFDTPVMKLLKEHIQNKDRESRIHQPALY